MIDRRVKILQGDGGEADTVTVSSLRDRPFLVLLGEPGIGKTTVLKTEAEAEKLPVTKVRELINSAIVSWPDTVFLDGLDEFRIGATDFDKIYCVAKKIQQAGVKHWRLACRSEDWKKQADLEAFKTITRGATITVAQILPLDRSESLIVLRALGEADPEAFAQRADKMGAAGLLESPLSIHFLHRSLQGGGQWPATRFDLFDQATDALAHEENDVHRHNDNRPSADVIRNDATRASLLLLVTDKQSLWRSGASIPTNEKAACLPATDLQIEPARINAMLDSALFRGEGEKFEPMHRTVAEFLGGRALAEAVVGDKNAEEFLGRAKALITGRDGRAASTLRGLYAWFAAHLAKLGKHGLACELVEADAVSVLIYGDAAVFDIDTKRAILNNLDHHDPFFRTTDVSSTTTGGLACEELAEDFTRALKQDDGTHRMLTVFEILTVGSPVVSLRPLLQSIILDSTREEWQRARAIQASLNGQQDDAQARRALFDALTNTPPSGVRESLRTQILGGLPPDRVSPEDIASVIHGFAVSSGNDRMIRTIGLQRFLVKNPRPDLFDLPFSLVPDASEYYHSTDISPLIDEALAAAIRATPDLAAERLWRWLGQTRKYMV